MSEQEKDFITAAIIAAIHTLDEVATNSRVSMKTRDKAAFARRSLGEATEILFGKK